MTPATQYPTIALRELLINALIHRDYSIHTDFAPITVVMYKNRIEIENPGGLYGRMTLDMLGKISPDTRNPFIANALEIIGETENRYSGIPTVIGAMKKAGLPAPKFENDMGVFKVTLYNSPIQNTALSSVEQEIIEFCHIPRSRAELEALFAGRFGISYLMAKYVHPMVKKGVLKLTIPSKPKSKNQKYFTE